MRRWSVVYAYTDDLHRPLGRIKIGKAEREAETIEEAARIRIKEQFTAGNADSNFEILRCFDSEKYNYKTAQELEAQMHKELGKYRLKAEGKMASEWFEISLDEVDKVFNQLVYGVYRKNHYTLRSEQLDAVYKALNYFDTGKDTFLFNAIMRFGKTFATYELMRMIEAKKVLVLTYKPMVRGEWQNELDNHVNYKDYKFVSSLGLNSSEEQEKIKAGQFVLFSSFQDILGTTLSGEIKDKFKDILNIEYDLVIVDEVHYGFGTVTCQNFLKNLNYKKRLDLSGTPINLMNSGFYEEDQIFTWSYLDEQKKKKDFPESEIYKWLPRINLYTYKVSEEVFENQNLFNEDEYLTLNKFFGVQAGKFIHENSINRFLDNLVCSEPRKFIGPFNDDGIKRKYLKHTFWYLPGVKEIKAMSKLLREHHYFKDYKILVAAGDNDGLGSDTPALVKDAIFKVDHQIGKFKGFLGTITLSCGKMNTGVSVPEWGSIFFLNDVQSVQDYWQTAFRCKTMNKSIEKKESYIFDFNPHRALNMMYEYALENSKRTESAVEYLYEFLNCMRVLAYDGAELIEKDISDLIRDVIVIGADAERSVRRFTSDWVFSRDFSNIDEKALEILVSVEGKKTDVLEALIIEKSGTGKGKTKIKIKGVDKEGDSGTEPDVWGEDFRNRLRSITGNLPTFLFCSSKEILDINDILETDQTEQFLDIVGVEVESFKHLVEVGLLNVQRLNKAIESFYITAR